MGQLEDLSASLAATKESVDELSLQMLQNEGIESKLAAILKATKEQTAALIAAVQEQTKAIENLAAPVRESGKRKRAEEPSADAGNEQETSANDSQTSAAEKLVSSSLKGKGNCRRGRGHIDCKGE